MNCKLIYYAWTGFPDLISWVWKQPRVGQFEKNLGYPLQAITDEISSITYAKSVEERWTSLVSSFVCLKDGKMNEQNVDQKLFHPLKKKYAREFENIDLVEYLIGYKLLAD